MIVVMSRGEKDCAADRETNGGSEDEDDDDDDDGDDDEDDNDNNYLSCFKTWRRCLNPKPLYGRVLKHQYRWRRHRATVGVRAVSMPLHRVRDHAMKH